MATSPLFVEDVATLQAKLRLTGLPSGEDGEALLNSAILRVRTRLIRRLGATRVAEIAAVDFEEDPETDDEVRRATANEAEVKWVRLYLLTTMPTLFMDNSGQTEEVWNTEAAFRPGRPTAAELQALWDDLEEDLVYLSGSSTQVQGNFSVIEPDDEPPDPGDSLFGPQLGAVAPPIRED